MACGAGVPLCGMKAGPRTTTRRNERQTNMALDKAKVVEDLSNATVLEIADLVKELESKWGVSAAAPVAVSAGPGGGGAAAVPVARGKTTVGDISVSSHPDHKHPQT